MKAALVGILVISLVTSGCGLGVMAWGIGYAVSSSKKGDAEIARAEAEIQKSYNEYKLGMEKINIERESKGLKPQPILPIEEWLRHQALPEDVRARLSEQQPKQPLEPKPAPQQKAELESQQQTGLGGP